MYSVYDDWPKIALDSFESQYQQTDYKNIDHIVFSGMGGSGSIGDLFSSILLKTNLHVSIVKGYLLPKTVDENTLVIATSVSGNSLETLNVLRTASRSSCKLISFSSGGIMESFCKHNNVDYRKIPITHSPRASFPSYVYSILNILESSLPISKNNIYESINALEKLAKKINHNNLSHTNPSLEIGSKIKSIPSIYYPHGLQASAIRFKNSLQENSKLHAITEDIIEVCHNGIEAWEKKSNVQPILLQGKDDYIKTKERWRIIKNFFKDQNIDFLEISSIDGNILTKLMHLIYLLDYSTIYNAAIKKTDPSPVTSIEYVKSKLKP
jgi:glucose/mannose-6-phosphate isomerase